MAEEGEGTLWNSTSIDQYYDFEFRGYFRYASSWRDIPKPSIAAVQGKCIGAGLMLCWPCDLIVAAQNASFSDPVLMMGIMGVEYHAHAYEFGVRKAKELLFTGDAISAEEAQSLGMVNQVVPEASLQTSSLNMANKIARMDPFALRMAKRAINQAQDNMGLRSSLSAAFDMHHLGHAHAVVATNLTSNVLADLDEMKSETSDPGSGHGSGPDNASVFVDDNSHGEHG